MVIGILIALQINNWNLDRLQRQEEIKTYQNIIIELIYLTNGKSAVYDQALLEINTIIDLIDSELDQNHILI